MLTAFFGSRRLWFEAHVPRRSQRGLSPHDRGCWNSSRQGIFRSTRRQGRNYALRKLFYTDGRGLGIFAPQISAADRFLCLRQASPRSVSAHLTPVCCEEFFRAFAVNSGITLHLRVPYGSNSHHMTEALFKAFAHALKIAVQKNATGETLSTKGVL